MKKLKGYFGHREGDVFDKTNELIDWCNEHEKEHKEIVKAGPYNPTGETTTAPYPQNISFGTNCDDKEMKAWAKVGKEVDTIELNNKINEGASYAPEGYVCPECQLKDEEDNGNN